MCIHIGELGQGGPNCICFRVQISAALVFVLLVSWAAHTVWTDIQERGLSWVVLQELLGLRSICSPPGIPGFTPEALQGGSWAADER